MQSELDNINIHTAIQKADDWFFDGGLQYVGGMPPDLEFTKWMRAMFGITVILESIPHIGTIFVLDAYDDIDKLTMFKLEWS